jgi:hypothetical protein
MRPHSEGVVRYKHDLNKANSALTGIQKSNYLILNNFFLQKNNRHIKASVINFGYFAPESERCNTLKGLFLIFMA